MHALLFDIDGTLLRSGGAGQAAMERALESVFGVTAPTEGIQAAGRTDFAITSDLLEFHGLENSPENRERFLDGYLGCLPEELASREGIVLPGVPELLDALAARSTAHLGLLTGNLQRGAAVKLAHYKMASHFRFGGFGDDHHSRDDVARAAAAEAASVLKRTPDSTWVIGDTPADVQCGRAIGATVVAVATGIYPVDVLSDAEPDYLFEDFSDVKLVLSILPGEPGNRA
jgi:phosphoglycolate phosphatase